MTENKYVGIAWQDFEDGSGQFPVKLTGEFSDWRQCDQALEKAYLAIDPEVEAPLYDPEIFTVAMWDEYQR